MPSLKRWTTADSAELYNIKGWSQGYYAANAKGHLTAHPSRNEDVAIDLKELVEDAQGKGLSLPLLIRFSDILGDRLAHLRHCFHQAIRSANYEGQYIGVYPIKVNQQRQVVEEVVRFGSESGFGLEAGSKSELHAVLATLESPETVVICNGYKDPAYVRLALLGQRLGKKIFLVVEKPGELALILRLAKQENLRPLLGVRIKLVSSGSGKWEDSGGDYSKFGLTASELVQAVELLRGERYLDCFRLIHIHLGSQITNIRRIKEALRETARYFVELSRLGCAVDHVDVGGGLGVDYDGSRSTSGFSINYTEQEYANDVVFTLAETCQHEGLPHPNIVTESGRAITAHHAMLAINVLETTSLDETGRTPVMDGEAPDLLKQLEEIRGKLNVKNLDESWHDALHYRDDANKLFELGYLSLHHRAQVDQLFWRIARRVEGLMKKEARVPEEFESLEILLADKYFCNFSVFQSLPDAWAIGQEFPVVPLHRLNEKPNRNGILQDITCDSDGRLKSYASPHERRATLPLHSLADGEPYYLGVFLTGAYQEILGDLHNLFGDTNAIHIALNDDGSWRYEQVIRGEPVASVLAYVQFHRDTLIDRIERQVQRSIRDGLMTQAEGKTFRDLYVEGLNGLTYLETAPAEAQAKRAGRRAAAEAAAGAEIRAKPKPARRARGRKAKAQAEAAEA
jgi:arginine decarboxylase